MESEVEEVEHIDGTLNHTERATATTSGNVHVERDIRRLSRHVQVESPVRGRYPSESAVVQQLTARLEALERERSCSRPRNDYSESAIDKRRGIAISSLERWQRGGKMSLEHYFIAVETVCRDNRIPRDTWASVARGKMDKDAFATLLQEGGEELWDDYDALKRGMLRLFGDQTKNPYPVAALCEMKLKADTSITEHVTAFLELRGKVPHNTPEKIWLKEIFLHTLDEQTRASLTLSGEETFDKVVSDCFARGKTIDYMRRSYRTTNAPHRRHVSAIMETDSPSQPGKMPRRGSEAYNELRNQGRCFYCKEEGHLIKNCPTRPKRTSRPSPTPTSSSSEPKND